MRLAGVTPLDVALDPDAPRRLELRLDGHETRALEIDAGDPDVVLVSLPRRALAPISGAEARPAPSSPAE